MIRLYLDWNVFVNMKNNPNDKLESLLKENRRKFNVYYSTAHIGDIYKSYNAEEGINDAIKSDLSLIKRITKSSCFYISRNHVVVDHREPLELLEDRIESEKILGNALSNNNSDMTYVYIQKMLADLPDFPIENKLTEEQKEQLKKFLPMDTENITIKNIANGLITFFREINTSGRYKDLRQIVQQSLGINRDKIFNSNNPYAFLDNLFQNLDTPENSFDDFQNKIFELRNEPAKDWFEIITSNYINLDITGYKEDNLKNVSKQYASSNNTFEDAFHTAFASQCDFYVTNDDRNYNKAKAVYTKLSINTRVLKPSEFIEYLEFSLKEDCQDLTKRISDKIKTGEGYSWENENNEVLYTFFANDFFLDYFNKIIWRPGSNPNEDDWMILLTKEKPTNGRFTIFNDIQMLLAKLIHQFNIPNDNRLLLDGEEIKTIQEYSHWEGRTWDLKTISIHFTCHNGYFQLYITSNISEVESESKIVETADTDLKML